MMAVSIDEAPPTIPTLYGFKISWCALMVASKVFGFKALELDKLFKNYGYYIPLKFYLGFVDTYKPLLLWIIVIAKIFKNSYNLLYSLLF